MKQRKVPYSFLVALVLFGIGLVWGIQKVTNANTSPATVSATQGNADMINIPAPTHLPPTITPIVPTTVPETKEIITPEIKILTDRDEIFAQIVEIEKQKVQLLKGEGWYYQEYQDSNQYPAMNLPGTDSPLNLNSTILKHWILLDKEGKGDTGVTIVTDKEGKVLQTGMGTNGKGINLTLYGNSALQTNAIAESDGKDKVYFDSLSVIPLLKGLPEDTIMTAWEKDEELVIHATNETHNTDPDGDTHINYTFKLSTKTGMPTVSEAGYTTAKGEDVVASQQIYDAPYQLIEKLPIEAETVFQQGQSILANEK